MNNQTNFDVIIIGGSYAGLSAAMALGRAMRKVLVIDSGKPCNMPTPHAHNFITHDGATPASIAAAAKNDVSTYKTVQFYDGLATAAEQTAVGFAVSTDSGDHFLASKLILATGLKDRMPDIEGFAECWGKSILHCPYCHGYEVRNEPTGILLNDAMAFELGKMISNWTDKLTIFTNGASTITEEQKQKLSAKNISIVETEVARIAHEHGMLKALILKDGSNIPLKAIYAKPAFEQHSNIPSTLGCAFTEQGLLSVDFMQKTTVPGVYACGDNANMFRSLAMSVACGSVAGAIANRELIEEGF